MADFTFSASSGPHVVFGKDPLYRREAVLDHNGVIGGAIVAQQVLQYIDGNVRALLGQLRQVLAHDAAGEMRIEQIVEAGIGVQTQKSKSSVIALSIVMSEARLLNAGVGIPENQPVWFPFIVRPVSQGQDHGRLPLIEA